MDAEESGLATDSGFSIQAGLAFSAADQGLDGHAVSHLKARDLWSHGIDDPTDFVSGGMPLWKSTRSIEVKVRTTDATGFDSNAHFPHGRFGNRPFSQSEALVAGGGGRHHGSSIFAHGFFPILLSGSTRQFMEACSSGAVSTRVPTSFMRLNLAPRNTPFSTLRAVLWEESNFGRGRPTPWDGRPQALVPQARWPPRRWVSVLPEPG